MLHHIGNGLDIQSGNMLLRGLVPSGGIADGVNYLAGQWCDDQHLNRQRDGEIVGEHAPESRERAECETECMMAPNTVMNTVISTTMRNLTVMPFHTARSVAAQNVFIIARELGVQMHKSQIMPTT